MDKARYKLVFAGEILPGFGQEDVRNNLRVLLSADKKTLGQLFSGQAVIIRKYLTIDQIQPYEQAMAGAGAACQIIPMSNDGEASSEIKPAQSVPPSTLLSRTLLSRIGRVRFAATLWPVVMLVAASWWLPGVVTQYLPELASWHLATVFAVLAGGLLLLATARRLYDFNASGWFSLLMTVPGVNCLLLLWLLFAPGTKGVNRFGPEPKAAGVIAQPLGLWLPLLVLIATGTYGALNYSELQQFGGNLLEIVPWLANIL